MAARRGNPHGGFDSNSAFSSNGSRPVTARRPIGNPVEEVLTVREGEAEMWMDEERMIVAAGQSLIVPAGRKHGFRNSGTTTLHIHAVLAAPAFEATMDGAMEAVRRWD
jgi:glyoxylate utilization-related uncharacterized protein